MATYKRQRYLFMTLDPVHIGTGGYRLGRVDNSIVREPGTKIPKIPGTSLHGAARSYAAQLYEMPEAAGQSHDKIENPDENPVCYTFGYLGKSQNNGDEGKNYSGVVNIFDAHVLLFPVHSMVGPVWVSTKERLEDAGFSVSPPPSSWNTDQAALTWNRTDPINLGWLMLGIAGEVTVTPPQNWQNEPRWKAVKKIVLVHDALFSQVVNSNLEVRTSVAINPELGQPKMAHCSPTKPFLVQHSSPQKLSWMIIEGCIHLKSIYKAISKRLNKILLKTLQKSKRFVLQRRSKKLKKS